MSHIREKKRKAKGKEQLNTRPYKDKFYAAQPFISKIGQGKPAPSRVSIIQEGIVGDVTSLLLFAPSLTVFVLQLDCNVQRCLGWNPLDRDRLIAKRVSEGVGIPQLRVFIVLEAYDY